MEPITRLQERYRMTKLAKSLVAELGGGRLLERMKSPDDIRREAEKRLTELQAERDKPIRLSREALRSVGVLTAPEDEFLQESLR